MTNDKLTGKRVLITGSSSGLGFAMARALGLNGASVLIVARHANSLDKALKDLKDQQIDAYALEMDVRSESSVMNAVKWVEKQWGTLDMLVNNAGIGMRTVNPHFLTEPKPFFEVSATGFRDLIDTNLTGYFLVAKAFVPFFTKQKKGKIVNISMNHETMKRKGFIPYGPSRAGAESLSLIMAEDLKDFQIDVNMLLPGGATETGMVPEEFKQSLPNDFKILSPDIMAEPIVFLASDESDGITGQRIIATQFNDWKRNHFNTN
jgi:gluconate 5-dehydrogenase